MKLLHRGFLPTAIGCRARRARVEHTPHRDTLKSTLGLLLREATYPNDTTRLKNLDRAPKGSTEATTTKERLAVMEALHGATTPLVLHGLVTLETTHAELRPAERPMTFFHLTQQGFDALLER